MPGGLALFVRLLDSGFAKPDPQIVGTKLVRGPPYRHRVKIVSRLLLDIHGTPFRNGPTMIAIRFARLSPQAKNRFVIVSFLQTARNRFTDP